MSMSSMPNLQSLKSAVISSPRHRQWQDAVAEWEVEGLEEDPGPTFRSATSLRVQYPRQAGPWVDVPAREHPLLDQLATCLDRRRSPRIETAERFDAPGLTRQC